MAAAKKTRSKSKPKKKTVKKPAVARKAAPPRKKTAAKKPAARRTAPQKAPARPAPKARPAAAPKARPAAPKARPAPAPKPPERGPLPGEDLVGIVTHYYGHLSVAVMRLDTGSLQVGDTIRILGHTTDFRQRVESLQIDHEAVTEVGRRQEFGMRVKEHVRENDVVYKVAAP